MKKILFLLVSSFFISSIIAQDYIPNKEEIEKFFSTKILVVLDDNPMSEFNLAIKDFMKKEWTLTPWDVIPYTDFESKMLDPQYSFIMMNKIRIDKDKTGARYRFLSVLLGGNEKLVSSMPDLCPVPICYLGVDEESYTYKLPVILRFMQNHIQLIRKDPSIVANNVFKYYNDNMADIKTKTLYVIKQELAPDCNTEAKIKKVYPNKFKIVTIDDVTKAINDRDESIVFLHKVGPEGTRERARCYNILIGAGDAKFYYFDYHMIKDNAPDGFLLKDFKRLGRK